MKTLEASLRVTSFRVACLTTATLAALVTYSSQASAQIGGNDVGIADPGRAQERIRKEMIIPQAAPDVGVKGLALQGAPEGAEKVKFKFGGIRTEGATVYAPEDLASIYQDKIGTEVSLADIYDIANQMTLRYRDDGYVLTQVVVPPQTIEGGVAKLQVVEGFVDRISVQPGEGEGAHATNTIKAYANQIAKTRPINVRSLERQLLLINDLPGVHARSILSPSKTTPGAADLLIIVERKPYDALLSVDDYGSRYLGPIQFGAAGTLNSVFGLNDAISGQLVMAHDSTDKELGYASASYEMPVGIYGTKLSALVSTTHTTPGYDLEEFNVNGRSHLISLKATHPFIRGRSSSLIGRFLFDWRNVTSQNDLEPTKRDYIRSLRAGLQYEFLDRLFGVGANVVDLEISKGLDVLNASDEGDDDMTRPFADPQATKANLEIQRLQRLSSAVNLLIEGRGQLSSDALLSSEEFAVGGFSSGRGYDPSEIVGDDGISGRLELQWNNPWSLTSVYYEKYQLFGFYDIGKVWNTDATTADGEIDSLASTGIGARFNFLYNIDGSIALAFPLTKEVQTQENNKPKFYFSLNKRF